MILAGIAALLGLLSIVLWGFTFLNSRGSSPNNQPPKALVAFSVSPTPTAKPLPSPIATPKPTATPAPMPTEPPKPERVLYQYPLAKTAITLAPKAYRIFPIIIGERFHRPRLVGRFVAEGGSGNDVDVFVTNDDGLINFKNGNAFKGWYRSGRITTDSVNVLLPPGQTYLIFSNRGSVFSHKAVQIDFHIEYMGLSAPPGEVP